MNTLTTPEARIVDLFMMWGAEDGVFINSLPDRSETTTDFLKKRIFFRDHVTVEDLSDHSVQVDIIGDLTGIALDQSGLPPVPPKGKVVHFSNNLGRGYFFDLLFWTGSNFRMLFQEEIDQALIKDILDGIGGIELNESSYEVIRVEKGVPGPGRELTSDYTPLENGLNEAVSLQKGCYTGQEVLARQVNYDKVTRHLRGLHLDSAVIPGSRILVDGRPVGTVTSAAFSQKLNAIGLGFVRRPHDEAGASVDVENPDGSITRAIVTQLPFET